MISIPSLVRGKGGAEKTAANLANALLDMGHKVAVICNQGGKKTPSYPLDPKIELMMTRYGSSNPGVQEQELEKIKEFNPEVVIIFYADISILWQLPLFRRTSASIIIQECTGPVRGVRNLIAGMRRTGAHFNFKAAFLLRQAIFNEVDGIRLVLPRYKKSVAPVFQDKTAAFFNFPGKPSAQSEKAISSSHKILCVGGLKDFNKNGIAAARAFTKIAPLFPSWELHFFGTNSFAKEIKVLNQLPGVEGRIVYRNLVNDMEAEYQSAKFTILCSFEEGNPNVVNESMLFGKPVIGFNDCEGFLGLVTDGENGVVVSRDKEIHNLSAAMANLIEDSKYLKKLSENCITTMEDRSAEVAYRRSWEQLIKSVYTNAFKRKEKNKGLSDILENSINLYR